MNFVFTQPVELRFNELLTGVREDVAIKLYGEDLGVLADKVQEIAAVIRSVPGAADLNVEATSGLPQMTVEYNRAKMAQYGVTVDKLNDYVSAAFSGEAAGVIFEGENALMWSFVWRRTSDRTSTALKIYISIYQTERKCP